MNHAGPTVDEVTEEVLRLTNETALRSGGAFAALSSLTALAPILTLLTRIVTHEAVEATKVDNERRNPFGFPVPGRRDSWPSRRRLTAVDLSRAGQFSRMHNIFERNSDVFRGREALSALSHLSSANVQGQNGHIAKHSARMLQTNIRTTSLLEVNELCRGER